MDEHLAGGFSISAKGNASVAMQWKQDSVRLLVPRGCGWLGAFCESTLACSTNVLSIIFKSSNLRWFFGAVPSARFTDEGLASAPN